MTRMTTMTCLLSKQERLERRDDRCRSSTPVVACDVGRNMPLAAGHRYSGLRRAGTGNAWRIVMCTLLWLEIVSDMNACNPNW